MIDNVRRVFADIFSIPVEEVHANTTPDMIPAWDSIQHLNLVLALEAEFGVQFTPEEIEQLLSVELIADLLTEKTVGVK